jgi:hypothetical protein
MYQDTLELTNTVVDVPEIVNKKEPTVIEYRVPAYQEVEKREPKMRKANPLAQYDAKVVGLDDRLKKISSNYDFKAQLKKYIKDGVTFETDRLVKTKMVKLKYILLDEDIQRSLDVAHAVKIYKQFDPAKAQGVHCIKIPGKEEYHAINGQHTLTVIAAVAQSGGFAGIDDWQELEVTVNYVETSDKAFAREAFAAINTGAKPLTGYDKHRISVMSRRIDKSEKREHKEAEVKQTICEKHDCYPVSGDTNNPLKDLPGTFTHMKPFNFTNELLDVACDFHNRYFHFGPIDGGYWFMIEYMYNEFHAARIPLSSTFLEEIAGIIQNVFADPTELQVEMKSVYRDWHEHRYGYVTKSTWSPNALSVILVQLYKKLGGTHAVPAAMVDEFEDLIDFLPDHIKDAVDNLPNRA